MPSESEDPLPGAPVKNASVTTFVQTALILPAGILPAEPEAAQAKDGKAGGLNESEEPKAEDRKLEGEASPTPLAVDVLMVKPNEAVLPLTFGWTSGTEALLPSVHEAAKGARNNDVEEEQPTVSTLPSGPIVSAPQSAPQSEGAVQLSRLDAQVPEELTSTLTMRDIVPATTSPKTALAFEARLWQKDAKQGQNDAKPGQPASLPTQEIPNGQHELNPAALPDMPKGAALPGEAAKPLDRSKHKEADRAVQNTQQAKSETVNEPASKGSSDSARQEHPDSRERKSDTPEAAGQAFARHAVEASPDASNLAMAQRTAARQTENAKPAEKHSLTAGTQQDIPETAAPRTEPARDISFRIGSANADAVDIKLTERAGQVRVAVHSADPVLTRSLQANVTELAGKLEHSGFHAETFLPSGAEPQANPNFQDSPKDRRAPHYEPQRQKKRSNETDFQINMLTNTHQENS